jgi:hypothetical protein
MLDYLYDPKPWRKRAEELRTVADGMKPRRRELSSCGSLATTTCWPSGPRHGVRSGKRLQVSAKPLKPRR